MDLISFIKENDTPEKLSEIKRVHIDDYYEIHLILFQRYFDNEDWNKINIVVNNLVSFYPTLVESLLRKTFLYYEFKKKNNFLLKNFMLYINLKNTKIKEICYNLFLLNIVKENILTSTDINDLIQIINFEKNIYILEVLRKLHKDFSYICQNIHSNKLNLLFCCKYNKFEWLNDYNKKKLEHLKFILPFNDNIKDIIIIKLFIMQS